MAANALTEKINKIRQLNEEIKRRHEEVEEDKKNAAKQNALVQMVPSTDWPERKEPPEFTISPKTKQKSTKERHEYIPQSHSGEGRKIHSFAQGEGPPPDPKYNFLADSEREEPMEYAKETVGSRSTNKGSRGSFRKKIGGRENVEKDNKINKGNYKDESQSGYDAWRAERNRIDEDRISRQRTAEGNWLREWDNDKFISHSRNDEFERDPNREHAPTQYYSDRLENTTFPTFSRIKKKYKDSGRRYDNNNEHVNYNQSGNPRPYRGSAKNVHGNRDNRSHLTYNQHRNNVSASAKVAESLTSEERTVIATDKSIKVTVNQSSATKGPVMSIKVNSPSIAGTGRVGPRQRTRVTYSHSDIDTPMTENESFFRQKSFEDKSKGTFFNNNQKFSNINRSHSQRKSDSRPLHYQRKEGRKEDNDTNFHKYHEAEFRSYSQKDQQKSYVAKSPKPMRGNTKIIKSESSNVNVSQKTVAQESLTTDETNVEHDVEHDVKTENSESVQLTEADHTEISTAETSEINIENKTINDIILKKESEETSLNLSSNTENTEHVDKDNGNKDLEEVANTSTKDLPETRDSNVNKTDFNNEKKSSEEVTNHLTEDVQENNDSNSINKNDSDNERVNSEKIANNLPENNDTSSEINNAQFKEVLVLNENNEVSDDIVKSQEVFSPKDDQQPLEQVVKQFVHADCKDTEDQVSTQQTVEVATDNSVSLLETNTQSVIEVNDQLACNSEVVQHQEEKTNENNESSDEILKDVNCSETNPEDTISNMNISINSTEEKKEKSEEIINGKVEDAEEL
ncbi:uncharacterized protein LOC117611592 [Osmia lignaria lignaria]|uniref:uncharacterized protein LOC117611592 n=1 Tax=Osmia lignaria lignaria TaxID=1437193 RepID=UPI00402B28D4